MPLSVPKGARATTAARACNLDIGSPGKLLGSYVLCLNVHVQITCSIWARVPVLVHRPIDALALLLGQCLPRVQQGQSLRTQAPEMGQTGMGTC